MYIHVSIANPYTRIESIQAEGDVKSKTKKGSHAVVCIIVSLYKDTYTRSVAPEEHPQVV